MYAQSGRPALPLALGNGNVSIIFITIDIDNPIFDDFRKKNRYGLYRYRRYTRI